MQQIKKILTSYSVDPTDKYVSREFQDYGLRLATELSDLPRKALYIKLAKETPRLILEEALSFVKDANARNKAALFMWKLKEVKSKAVKS